MVKLSEITNIRKKELIEKLINENVSKQWLRDILLQKSLRSNDFGGHHIPLSLTDVFERFIWDNLTEEQQNKVIEALNLIIEEDLYKPVEFGSYYQDLIGMVCMIEKKIPGLMNSNLILKWKNEGFPNLAKPKNYSSSLQAEFTQKIENAFGKN